MSRLRVACFFALALITVFSRLAAASDTQERFQMGHDIRIAADEKVGDVSCLNCSVHILGHVQGDVFALHGNVTLESGASVSGDISTLIGDVRMESGSSINGDVAAIAGGVRRQPQSTIGGDVSSMEGTQWLLLIVFVPVVILAAIVALIVWLVQRNRRPVRAVA